MTTLILNKKRGSVLSLLLYVLGTAVGVAYNYYFVYFNGFSVDAFVITVFFGIFVVHESTHYISYRLIGRGERVVFSKDKKWDIPYFKSEDFIDKKKLIISLVLPFFTTSMMVMSVNSVTGNFTYSFLLGISFAMSGADIVMASQLAKETKREWKALDREFGFVGID